MGKKLRNAALGLTMAGIVAGGLTSCGGKGNKQPTKKTNKTEIVSTPSLQQKEIDYFRFIFNDATSYDVSTDKDGYTTYIAEYIPTPEQKRLATEKLKKLEKLKKTILETENPKLHQSAREGNLQSVQVALEKGADINSIDPETGKTALQEALSCPNFAKASRIVTLLANNPQIEVGQAVKDEIKEKIQSGDCKWQSIQGKLSIAKKTQPTVLEQINTEIEQTKPARDGVKILGAFTHVSPNETELVLVVDGNTKISPAPVLFDDKRKGSLQESRNSLRKSFSIQGNWWISNGITWEEALRIQQQASRQ